MSFTFPKNTPFIKETNYNNHIPNSPAPKLLVEDTITILLNYNSSFIFKTV